MAKRWHVLSKLIKRHGLRKCAEIGVKAGRNMGEICRACPETEWIAVDPWIPTEYYSRWPDKSHAINEKKFDQMAARAKNKIRKVKAFSVDAAQDVQDASLDLVFIDGDHSYEGVRADIDAWLPKVKKGGFITGHGYDNTNKYGDAFKGVDRAVHETFGDDFEVDSDHVWIARV